MVQKFGENVPVLGETLCFLLTGKSTNAAKILLEIAIRNEHMDAPFSEENSGLTFKEFAQLLEDSGLNRHVWSENVHENISPILFRSAQGRADTAFDRDDHLYYMLTPINTDDPSDVEFNEPASGRLLTTEEQTELLLKTFGTNGLRVEFGIGAKIISDNTTQAIADLLPPIPGVTGRSPPQPGD